MPRRDISNIKISIFCYFLTFLLRVYTYIYIYIYVCVCVCVCVCVPECVYILDTPEFYPTIVPFLEPNTTKAFPEKCSIFSGNGVGLEVKIWILEK